MNKGIGAFFPRLLGTRHDREVKVSAAFAACFALTMAAFADPAILGRGLKNFVSNFLQDRYLGLGDPPQGAAIGILLLLIVSLGTAAILVLGRRRRR